MKSSRMRSWISGTVAIDFWHRIGNVNEDHRLGHELDRDELELVRSWKPKVRRVGEDE